MKTIMLRFSDAFATKAGTIIEHQKIIKNHGFVWFGKRGNKISPKITQSILKDGPIKYYWFKVVAQIDIGQLLQKFLILSKALFLLITEMKQDL